MKNVSSEGLTFEKIKLMHGSSLGKKIYQVDNGCNIVATRKLTFRGKGVVLTDYMHIQYTKPDGKIYYYREQKDGTFKGGQIA